jgi:hypothetical protein
MTMRKTILLASMLGIVACGGRDFDQPYRIDTPRILAVKAEPPQPSYATTSTLSTLLYQPPLDRVADKCPNPGATTYSWSWCPWPLSSNSNYECPITDAEFSQFYATMGLGPAPSLDLGHGETATFTNPFPAQVLYALCRGDIGTSLDEGSGVSSEAAGKSVFYCDIPAEDTDVTNKLDTHPIGFRVSVKLTVTPACPELLPEGFSPLVAVYTLHLPTNDAIPVNQNPVLDGIWVTDNGYSVLDGGVPGDDTGSTGIDASAAGLDSGAAGSPTIDAGAIDSDGIDGDGIDGGVIGGTLDGGTAGGSALDGGVDDATPSSNDAALGPGPSGGEPDAGRQGPDGSTLLDDHATVQVKRDRHVGIQLDIGIEQAEHLAVPSSIDFDSSRNLTRHYEHLNFAWFAEAGKFTGRGKGDNTGYLPPLLPPGEDNPPSADDYESFLFNTTNTWDLPKVEDYKQKTARIIVVVRDGRGGVDWTSKVVSLEDQP